MHKKIVNILVICTVGLSCALSQAKPFERVLLLSGGKLRMAVGMGMLAEAFDNPHPFPPNVVLYSCGLGLGGAVASAMLQMNGGKVDTAQWLQFLQSRTFFAMMKEVKVNQDFFHKKTLGDLTKAKQLYHEIFGRLAATQANGLFAAASSALKGISHFQVKPLPPVAVRPAIFRTKENSLINVPQDLAPPNMNLGFSSDGLRVIFGATKILYKPDQAGKSRGLQEKLYEETYFTDPRTADAIRRVGYDKSVVAADFPEIPVQPLIAVKTGYPLFAGAGASLREPYLTPLGWVLNPETREKEPYLAGSLNGSPIELALALGDNVMAIRTRKFTRKGPLPPVEDLVYRDTFGFSFDKRVDDIDSRYGKQVRWISVDGTEELEEKSGFSPVSVGEGENMVLVDKMPMGDTEEDFQKFSQMATDQWNWGMERMREALKSK